MLSEKIVQEKLATFLEEKERQAIQKLSLNSQGDVTLIIQVLPLEAAWGTTLKQKIKEILKNLPGVHKVECILTSHRNEKTLPKPQPLQGVKKIVAVASGKGGVGKSTTSLQLAVAFSKFLRVGILDADVYGPSLPHLLKLQEKPSSLDGKILEPLDYQGIACMSMGFLIPEAKAAIWRGPIVQSAIQQMLRQVNWGKLDILVVDLPPGTGDVQLTLCQSVPLDGVIIVSTPQDLALIDVRRGIQMFQQVGVPIAGVIENMSFFTCPHCQQESSIFHHGGARKEAERQGLPFLGEIPLSLDIRQATDEGTLAQMETIAPSLASLYADIAYKVYKVIH